MSELLTPDMKAWIGRSEPPMTVEVTRREIVKYAIATEQHQEKYLRGDEAPPMFLFGLFRPVVPVEDLAEDGLATTIVGPPLPLKRNMAGGLEIKQYQPIRPGQQLVGTRTLVDMNEKTGRQGPIIFMTYKLAVTTEDGEPVADEFQTRIAR
ncbi:MAG: MaoC family dehydratase N-terminal domain-containing protein [Pseudomonadota bacterium]